MIENDQTCLQELKELFEKFKCDKKFKDETL
jgi:hypothetical protein